MNYGTSRQCVQIPLKVMFLHLMMEKCDVCLSGEKGYSANFILEVCAFVYISLEKRKTWKKTFGWWDCGCLAPPPTHRNTC